MVSRQSHAGTLPKDPANFHGLITVLLAANESSNATKKSLSAAIAVKVHASVSPAMVLCSVTSRMRP
jgi:hypothetical protein